MPEWLMIMQAVVSAIQILAPLIEQLVSDIQMQFSTGNQPTTAQLNLLSSYQQQMDQLNTAHKASMSICVSGYKKTA